MPRIHNILVANRGEIAWRIMRTARALGHRTTAIYSSADADSPHVAYADTAICIGPPAVTESYLAIDRILGAARSAAADAIHPGYGLLSENADFAQACLDAGLTFIGPRPDAIRLMGDKQKARIAVQAHGVPCVPGYDGDDQSLETLTREAARIGYPIMVKAAAGGGGRGMRRVEAAASLAEAISRASSEAQKAFGAGRLILERAIDSARHVEIQVFADSHGQVIHLGERDCSIQRRFQKVIEESPSPAVDRSLRQRMGAIAVSAAKSCNYLGAGTVELLLAPDGSCYFLEMNTRIQVEHPVTELVTGQDLVAWQIKIAEGEPLPISQDQVQLQGHAIEARLYAEEPAKGFIPATGQVRYLSLPDHVRIDHTLREGLVIGSHYDALLAKIIAHGADRDQARSRLITALQDLRILGVATNQTFLISLLQDSVFQRGEATTDYLDRRRPAEASAPTPVDYALAALLFYGRPANRVTYAPELQHFTNCRALETPILVEHAGQPTAVSISVDPTSDLRVVKVSGEPIYIGLLAQTPRTTEFTFDEQRQRVDHIFDGNQLYLQTQTGPLTFTDITYALPNRTTAAGSGEARAPMDGAVIEIPVKLGDQVDAGQTVAVMEAMKLQLQIPANRTGKVTAIHATKGSQVKTRQVLVEISAD